MRYCKLTIAPIILKGGLEAVCSMSPPTFAHEWKGIGETLLSSHQIVGYHKLGTRTCLDSVESTEHLRLGIFLFCR